MNNIQELETFLGRLEQLTLCHGTDFGGFSPLCPGWVISKRALRSSNCKILRKSTRKKNKPTQKPKGQHPRISKQQEVKQRVKNPRKSLMRAKAQIRLKKKKKNDGPDVTSKLVVLNIIRAAKAKGPSGRRYDLEWVFHCLLMRIKSPKLYDHIRKREILPLPDRTSIYRYMQKVRPVSGYQKTVFEVLSSKTANWSKLQRHGVLLLDEMILQPGTEFDRNTLLHWGFELGDHALVVLFQPFAGGWVQSLGCFLSKGNPISYGYLLPVPQYEWAARLSAPPGSPRYGHSDGAYLWDKVLVVAACLVPMFRLDCIRTTVEGNDKVHLAREWLEEAMADLPVHHEAEEDEPNGENPDYPDPMDTEAMISENSVGTLVKQMYSSKHQLMFNC
ncbi:Transposable element P transposase [Frankliniella fusca]|uniref:Transposable element P transposase n=1 Tax=Frankliniella fusca TaxID=407009 RepID=A0AAE1HNA6_9NEOP|nr:Transposable element P transposase [Frankliniella fusca]